MSLKECETLRLAISRYCYSSSQLINLNKSGIFFSPNTPAELKNLISNILLIQDIDKPGIYLGLPTAWRRSKREVFSWIKEKLQAKLWNSAGKEVLIKSVLQAMPLFAMFSLKFPSSFCKELNALVVKFRWSKSDKSKGIHRKLWEKLSE